MHTLQMVFEMIQVLELQRLSTALGMAAGDLLRATQFLQLPFEMVIHGCQPVVPKYTLFV